LRQALRVAFALAALLLLILATMRQWDDFVAAVAELDATAVTVSFAAVLAALVLNMLAWREAMAAVDIHVSLAASARVFYLSQLGKYVPGSVWPVVAQMELTRDTGVSRVRGATGAIVAMVVGVATSSAVASTLLVLPHAEIRSRYWWVVAVVPVVGAALHPAVLRRLLAPLFRVTRRSPQLPTLNGAALLRATAWSAGMWLALGAHAYVLTERLASPRTAPFLIVTGAMAFAWVVGFLVVLAPAGLGVREGALTLALATVVPTSGALALAVVSRVLMTLGDAAAAGVVILLHRYSHHRSQRRSSTALPEPPLSEGRSSED